MNEEVKILSLKDFDQEEKTNTYLVVELSGAIDIPVDKSIKSIKDVNLDEIKLQIKNKFNMKFVEINKARVEKRY